MIIDAEKETLIKNYDWVARGYAEFNYKKMRSVIVRSKMSQLREIFPGNKVLFAGSGPGEDSLAAAQKGADVTCLDVSARMLDFCAQKFEEQGLCGRFINANVVDHHETYDVVVANFFLNIFNREMAKYVLIHLASLLKPGGILMIADISPLEGNFIYRSITYIGYMLVAAPAALIGLTSLHTPYEYEHFFEDAGLQLKWDAYFRKIKIGPLLYKTWAAVKKG